MLFDLQETKVREVSDQLIFHRFLQIEKRVYFVLARLRKQGKLLAPVKTISCNKYNYFYIEANAI